MSDKSSLNDVNYTWNNELRKIATYRQSANCHKLVIAEYYILVSVFFFFGFVCLNLRCSFFNPVFLALVCQKLRI